MSLSNTSQLLLRNIELLNASTPLLINFPADSMINEYLSHYPQTKITCYNTNFEHYEYLQQKLQQLQPDNDKPNCYFSALYTTKIKHDLVIIHFPKSKAELQFTLAMLSEHLTTDARILIVGENKGGVKSAPKLTTNFMTQCNKVDSARHCNLFFGCFNNQTKPFNLEDWYHYYPLEIDAITMKIAALPGVFSQGGLDKGTALLLPNLPKNIRGKVLDFGCGAGVIACFIGKKYSDIQLSLIDINALALQSAKKTLEINNLSGNVFASNSLSKVNEKYQHVVSNPPFHQGLKTHYAATESFLHEIKRFISSKGDITIVANSFLKYRPIMEDSIGRTNILLNNKGFTIYQCQLK
ncbi:MAG: methyltransferase [Alteromonadaceae bacterium]|nr:methyltransferase [Alteromonadaceae bacterium]